MSPRLFVLFAILILGCRLAAGDSAAVAAAKSDPAAVAADLIGKLPKHAGIVRVGDEVRWTEGAASAVVAGIEAGSQDPLLATVIGPIRVPRSLVEERRAEVLAALPALADRAKAAGLPAQGLTLQTGILTGPSLRNDTVIVTSKATLKKLKVEAADRSGQRQAITQAIAQVNARLDATPLDASGRMALKDVLIRLDRPDGNTALDEVTPSFARRLVRHGWARQWFAGDPAGTAAVAGLEKAVFEAESLAAVSSLAGDGSDLSDLRDGFGRGGHRLAGPDGVRYTYAAPNAEYLGKIAPLQIVVDLPAGSDPTGAAAAEATAVRAFLGQNLIASWTVSGGLVTDPQRWRSAVRVSYQNPVSGAIPPHLLVAGLNGDIAFLAVERGVLRPAKPRDRADAERFITDAARLLPTAAHLDLIGQYLMKYVYPSPDARFPELIGNKEVMSNFQQTWDQTLGNTAGGYCRGDCADIAELYHDIAVKQGRHPIVIGLPEHAACTWAEKRGKDWTVSLLQTGPAHEYTAATLPEALEQTYKSFDPNMPFDANGIPLLLRFSGEVSRSAWRLSWRIFAEPAYRDIMIDVQRDWHFQTYQRGIRTMLGMIAKGDDDNANYRELSGLYTFTGQFALAAEYQQKALDRTQGDANKLYLQVELVGHLINAGKLPQAKALVQKLLDGDLPARKDQLGDAYFSIALELAGSCGGDRSDPELNRLGVQVLHRTVAETLGGEADKIAQWLDSPQFNADIWNERLKPIRRLLLQHASVAMELLRKLGPGALPGDEAIQSASRAAQRWLDRIAFRDVAESSEVMVRYAEAGHWYEAVLGLPGLDAKLAVAPLPAAVPPNHAKRLAGAAQLEADLPWIRASVPYWVTRIRALFTRERTKLDPAEIARLGRNLETAIASSDKLGIVAPGITAQAIIARQIVALVGKDAAALRRLLREVKERNDKALRDDCAEWLGNTARFLDLAWYEQVIALWTAEVDYKPKYYWIAWRAALNDAPRHALLVARAAAKRFADDPAFVEECRFMEELLGSTAKRPEGERALAPKPIDAAR